MKEEEEEVEMLRSRDLGSRIDVARAFFSSDSECFHLLLSSTSPHLIICSSRLALDIPTSLSPYNSSAAVKSSAARLNIFWPCLSESSGDFRSHDTLKKHRSLTYSHWLKEDLKPSIPS